MSQKPDLAELANVTGRRNKRPEPAKVGTRDGTRSFTVHIPLAVRQQIYILSAEQDVPIQQLFFEAMNDLFAKYGKPEICPIRNYDRHREQRP
jgi:hypothetical protein